MSLHSISLICASSTFAHCLIRKQLINFTVGPCSRECAFATKNALQSHFNSINECIPYKTPYCFSSLAYAKSAASAAHRGAHDRPNKCSCFSPFILSQFSVFNARNRKTISWARCLLFTSLLSSNHYYYH